MVETVGIHQVMWFVMLKSAKDRVIGVDTSGQQVPPRVVIPRSEKEGTKPPYVCPGCSNHTHDNNIINRCNVMNK
jgi:hypothetical protein